MAQWLLRVLMVFLPVGLNTQAAIITVDDNGPAQYSKIQYAINASVDGDTVEVATGHYYENIDFRGKAITVTSTDPNDPNMVENTIIDANGSGIVVSFHTDENPNSILTGFTITGGHAKYGSGICCWGTCSPSISHCNITANYNDDISNNAGGGIYVSSQANPTLIDSTVYSNSANSGGGIFCDEDSTLTITDCNVCYNTATFGGGIRAYGTITLTNCTVYQNSAAHWGGGISSGVSGILTLNNCTVCSNSAESGGGIDSFGTSTFTLNNCTVCSNTANSGGGVCSYDDLVITKCTICQNTADYGGGVCSYDDLVITKCTICQNSAYYGGGIVKYGDGHYIVTDSVFSNNTALDGGAIFAEYFQDLLVHYCTLFANTSQTGFGAGIACYESSGPAVISHNIIACSKGGAGIYMLYAAAEIDYNDLWDNPGGDYGGWAWPGEGDISVDPCFVQPGYWDDNETPSDPSDDVWVDGDYHLRPDSLCINTGDPGYTPQPEETDIDGEPRIRLGRVDIGADEAGSNPADFDETGLVDMADYAILSAAWASAPSDAGWDQRCNIAIPDNAIIDILDVVVFCSQWLWQAPWAQGNIDVPWSLPAACDDDVSIDK